MSGSTEEAQDAYAELWADHARALQEVKEQWFASGWAETAAERHRAMYHVMQIAHTGFNVLVAPRQDFPYFTKTHAFHHPMTYTWGLCCPDFHYQFTFLDGAHSYRITGKRGTMRWSEIHLQNGFWGDPNYRQVGIIEFDKLEMDTEGNFEIVVSPEQHPGNWFQTDPSEHHMLLVVRDAIYDWNSEEPAQVHIERLAPEGGPLQQIEDRDLPTRIANLTGFVRASAREWIGRNNDIVADVGLNTFWPGREQGRGGIQHAAYHFMVFDIADDEALVIEADVPKSGRFWAVQLANLYYDTVDYLNNQSSLNGHQTVVNADGKARFVLTRNDPGVANWLDPVGNRRGVAAWRWVYCDNVTIPKVTRIKLADLEQHLPGDTARVTADQRRATIAARAAGIRRLYDL